MVTISVLFGTLPFTQLEAVMIGTTGADEIDIGAMVVTHPAAAVYVGVRNPAPALVVL